MLLIQIGYYSFIVAVDALVFFYFTGIIVVCISTAVFMFVLFFFYRSNIVKYEWRISMVVALSLFINNYAIIWPYTTYGLLRLEIWNIQSEFVRSWSHLS